MMVKRTFNTPAKIVVCFALIAVLAVGAFADYQNAREYNVDTIDFNTSSVNQFLYEINYQGYRAGNYRFSDTLHANGVYRYDSASYNGGNLSVPYPPYSPVYFDYLYQSEHLPNPSGGFNFGDMLVFNVNDINLTIPEGYTYLDMEIVSYKGTFVTFALTYEMSGERHTQTLDYTSPNVYTKQTTFLPNFSQSTSYQVTSSVARYVVDVTGLIPTNATLMSVQYVMTVPRIPITQAVYDGTPAARRHVNYIMYITPLYITVNETDISRILYETQTANDTLTLIESTNRDIYEAIQRNQRYERMIDDFLNTMGRVNMGHDVQPDVPSARMFFGQFFLIDPIPQMLGLSVTFIFLAAFIRKA